MEGVNPNSSWNVNQYERVSACDNRPGLKMFYVTVLDAAGMPLRGVKVGFNTEPSEGIVYDHMDLWGITDKNGYAEWDHLGVPTLYNFYVGDELVIGGISTNIGNEYCGTGRNPVNRPGICSFRLTVQKKGEAETYTPPSISDVNVTVQLPEGKEGYAIVTVTCNTDKVACVKAHYGSPYSGMVPGETEAEVCDPYSVNHHAFPPTEAGLHHLIGLGTIWYSNEVLGKYCLQLIAWEPEFEGVGKRYGYSEVIPFTV